MRGPDVAPLACREGAWRPAGRGEAPGGRGELRRRPAPAPGERARGGVFGPCARVTHSTSPGRRGGNRKLLANSWAGPLAARELSPSTRLPALLSLLTANHVPETGPSEGFGKLSAAPTALGSSWLQVFTLA